MPLFLFRDSDESDDDLWVEAKDSIEAIGVWRRYMKLMHPTAFDGDEDPESIHLMHDGEVLRNLDSKPTWSVSFTPLSGVAGGTT